MTDLTTLLLHQVGGLVSATADRLVEKGEMPVGSQIEAEAELYDAIAYACRAKTDGKVPVDLPATLQDMVARQVVGLARETTFLVDCQDHEALERQLLLSLAATCEERAKLAWEAWAAGRYP
jgi:hypothetical protein